MADAPKTRATPVRPPKPSFLGGAVPTLAAATNMTAEEMVSLTFSVPKEFHRRCRFEAAVKGISMKDLLTESFELWERQNGR